MNLHELTSIVSGGESERVEFKKSTGQRSEAAKTVCGMLNGLGGFVLFGVTDDGKVRGQKVSAGTLEDVANELQRIEPAAYPEIETVAIDGVSAVVVLRVSGGGGPYCYDGRPYVRHGPTTRPMPRPRYDQLILNQLHETHRWENRPAAGVTIADLDHAEILRTIEESIRRQRMDDPGTRDVVELLTGLKLTHDGQLLNAAVVLFGKTPRLGPIYPQCLVRLARFRGRDKSEFLDNRQESGHAFDLLLRSQRFLRDHLPVAGRVVPDQIERVDEPAYPPEALREALANALCHRDYSVGGGSVSVGIYDDRLEITSTGLLPFDLTPADLVKPHPSRPRNPLIAQVFYRRGIIETWGRGTIKMAELAESAGLAAPEFESAGGEVSVRFRRTRYVAPTRVGHDLSNLQRTLLGVLSRAGHASLSEIRTAIGPGAPDRTIQENLQVLRQLGQVDSTGRGRYARWILKGAGTRDRPSS